jgi:hypothetical protein
MKILLTIAVFVFGLVFGIPAGYVINEFGLFSPKSVQAPATTVIKDMLPIGEWASLSYYYTKVVHESDQKVLLGWGVPGTTKELLYSYDGIIKLGVDANKITVEEITTDEKAENPVTDGQEPILKLRIILPPIRVLSHEIKNDSVVFYIQSGGLLNHIKMEDVFSSLSKHMPDVEQKALTTDLANQARISMGNQLKSLLERLPSVKEKNYAYEFVWNKTVSTRPRQTIPAK